MKKRAYKIIGMFFVFCLGLGMAYSADASRITKFESDTLYYINKYRSQYGLAPLRFDMKLQALAREHSSQMSHTGALGHHNFGSRYNRSRSRGCAENVGLNSRTPSEQFTDWRDSSGHRKNMLDRTMSRAGVSKVGAYVTFFACQ